jgi:amidophosphoribosyltransferase
VNADSLAYLSIEGLRRAVGGKGSCDACFNGDYPMGVPEEGDKMGLEAKETDYAAS